MLDQIFSSIKELGAAWGKLSPTRKAGTALIVITISVCLLGFGAWVGEKSYSPLYTDLQPDSSIALVKFLQEERIPYLVDDDGKTVSIPPEFVQQTLMKLAIQGMPAGNKPGMELFDKESFGTSSYVQRINYVRAIQGELTRTINTIRSIKKSAVHISMPPKQSFLDEVEAPKASVVIELYPGADIVKEEIRGIQNLIAFSVEGLRPQRVTVVDSTGRSLSTPSDEASSMNLAFAERQQQIEKSLEANVETMLSKIYGNGNVVVRVNAELDFNAEMESSTVVDPEGSAVVSKNLQENNSESKRPGPSEGPAPAGVQSAIPTSESTSGSASSTEQNVNKVSDRSEFEISKTHKQKEKALGGVKRLTVAVLVNSPVTVGADGKSTAKPLSDDDKARIEKLVGKAIGFVQSRDEISVESSEFAREDLEKADRMLEEREQRQFMFSILRYGSIALLAFIFVMVVIRPFIRWLTGLSATKVEKILPKTVEELEQLEDVTTNALPGLANMPLLEETVDLDKAEGELLKEKLISLVDMHPDKAAQIIADWILQADMAAQIKKAARAKR